MGFSFYPNHEHKCPHVSHCPHLGGAALGTLVLLANEQELSRQALQATIDAQRARGEPSADQLAGNGLRDELSSCFADPQPASQALLFSCISERRSEDRCSKRVGNYGIPIVVC